MNEDTSVLLNDVLQYKNQRVLNRYKEDFPGNSMSPENALEELLKFFWLSQKHRSEIKQYPRDKTLSFACAMHKEMVEIDDMWHTFLLFTKDYMHFCDKYFKEYIHHNPFDKNTTDVEKDFLDDLTKYLSYIYDNLGEQTLIKWFLIQ